MDYKEFVTKEFRQVAGSNIFLSLVTEDYLKDDGRCALELGFAMLLDKPIRLLVKEGTKIPNNIKRVAEKIEYFKAEDDIGIATKRLLR